MIDIKNQLIKLCKELERSIGQFIMCFDIFKVIILVKVFKVWVDLISTCWYYHCFLCIEEQWIKKDEEVKVECSIVLMKDKMINE